MSALCQDLPIIKRLLWLVAAQATQCRCATHRDQIPFANIPMGLCMKEGYACLLPVIYAPKYKIISFSIPYGIVQCILAWWT